MHARWLCKGNDLRVGEAFTKSMNSSADLGGAMLRVVDGEK